MVRPRFVLVLLSLLTLGCVTEPRSRPVSTPNLLVRNTGWTPLQVGGWPTKFVVPCPSPGCFLGFKTVNGLSSTCLPFPDSLFLRLIGIDSLGVPDTAIVTWRADEPITLIARTGNQSGPVPGLSVYTADAFIPATSVGWRIEGPTGWEAGPVASGSCST